MGLYDIARALGGQADSILIGLRKTKVLIDSGGVSPVLFHLMITILASRDSQLKLEEELEVKGSW